ncbi:MAG: hypothetical protein A2Y17_05825 [Clostridiales bacterium GWF2_38_85]|nr:MAG: hypothetical protein A2Y17_05825 [Clostridiales bacterium GWF2_38_85]HBL83999.1 hypothetical protein [Clostridiales bacterium]
MKKLNHLSNSSSPYLLQHAENPVDWFQWGPEAFEQARKEDKPVFVSIGYSTCHWCHVMAHESFEDEETANILNNNFISIKVDKEERPDIDSIYMSVCIAFTESGGWPTSIFMTPEQKPFFAGTYFPKTARYGMSSFNDLLLSISDKWKSNKAELIYSAEKVIEHLKQKPSQSSEVSDDITNYAYIYYKKSFDKEYGGFGNAPKFPTPHNLLFLMDYYETDNEKFALDMVEKTLLQMYKGGIFDHIGFGFSRYSTDRYFLVPHFEKMLYDNALLMIAYSKAYYYTNKNLYKLVAEKIATYILREMTAPNGGFYSAQDADSDGVEGKYYVFNYNEIVKLLGDKGEEFNKYYSITKEGNFEGKNIPNLLGCSSIDDKYNDCLEILYEYRKTRTSLHLDDKQLTSWNSLMITAFTILYRITQDNQYLKVAQNAIMFIDKTLCLDNNLYVSCRNGVITGAGFLDDYAFYIFALINLYEATLDNNYLEKARAFCEKAIIEFYDYNNGGFYLYGNQNEQLIIKPKETYDGAIPSGNSVMAYNLVRLSKMTGDNNLIEKARDQLEFMSTQLKGYPAGYSFFLLALTDYQNPKEDIVCVLKDISDIEKIKGKTRLGSNMVILTQPTDEYKLLNEETTFYICKNHACLHPTNDFTKVILY